MISSDVGRATDRTLRLAVFGAGRIGALHARNASAIDGVNIAYIVDPAADATVLTRAIGAKLVDAQEVFSDTEIDGILICSSTDTHAELLMAAAQRGLPVFCEKPISLDFETVQTVTATVEASGIPCMLGFQRRYDPDFLAIHDRIQSGETGRLEQLVMHTRDPSPPSIEYVRRSGGMLRDQAIHDFDQARFMTGEEITTVYAVGNCQVDEQIAEAGDIDTLSVTMTTASGRMIIMANSRRGPLGYDQRLEAHCARESLFLDNAPRSHVRVASQNGGMSAPPQDYFIARFEQAYREEMAAFIAYVRGGKAPHAGIRDGLEAQRLAEAALASIRSGQPVHLAQSRVTEKGAA